MKLPANSANSAYCSLHTAGPLFSDASQKRVFRTTLLRSVAKRGLVFRFAHLLRRRGGLAARRAFVATFAAAATRRALVAARRGTALTAARRRARRLAGRQPLLLTQQRLARQLDTVVVVDGDHLDANLVAHLHHVL